MLGGLEMYNTSLKKVNELLNPLVSKVIIPLIADDMKEILEVSEYLANEGIHHEFECQGENVLFRKVV